MEFSKLDTRAAADEGRILHVRHPFMGHKMYYGPGSDDNGERLPGDEGKDAKPVTFTVRGFNCATMKKLTQTHSRRRMRAGKMKPSEEQALNEQIGEEVMDAVVMAWDGFFDGGKPLPCTLENKREMFERAPDLWAQVQEFAADQGNFSTAASAA